MATSAKPDDLLHRYLLRPNALKKVRERLEDTLRQARRDPLRDAQKLHPNARTVFDVGANIGYVAYDFHRAWPEAKIYCFEPTPETFETLSGNVAEVPTIECIRAAVSDEDGTAEFRVDNGRAGGGANSLLKHAAEFELAYDSSGYKPVEVRTLRIDSFCADRGIDHVDLLKLDIEGAEPRAVVGAGAMLADSAIDMVLSEVRMVPGYEGGVLMHELTAQFADLDYRPFGTYHFAESQLGQSLWGDTLFLSPAFRRRLIAKHGASACGFKD